jgi:hypothetical protein
MSLECLALLDASQSMSEVAVGPRADACEAVATKKFYEGCEKRL